jgi:outer membrane protein TolC
VLTAEANLSRAEMAVAASNAAFADDQVNVFLALGGGWELQFGENLRPTLQRQCYGIESTGS